MSTLLRHTQIREVLRLNAVPEPEVHDLYLHLLSVFSNIHGYLINRDQLDRDGFRLLSVNADYVYRSSDGGNRKVAFTITSGHDISQIFLFCIFMELGIITHRSRLSIDVDTPKELIRIACRYLNDSEEPDIPF